VQGVQAHPHKMRFVENPGKIPENPGKIPENLGKIPENLNKIPENLCKTGAQPCLTSKMPPSVCRKGSEDHFLEVTPRNGRQNLHDNFLGKFRKIWAEILFTPKNLLAPAPMLTVTTAELALPLLLKHANSIVFATFVQ